MRHLYPHVWDFLKDQSSAPSANLKIACIYFKKYTKEIVNTPLCFQVFAQNFEAHYLKIMIEWHPNNSLDPGAASCRTSNYDPSNSYPSVQNYDLPLGWPLYVAKKRKSFKGIKIVTS